MPRSHINGNFIDKTSSIVANNLLQIIPTTSGKKGHLLIIEMVRFDSFFFLFSLEIEKLLSSEFSVQISFLPKASIPSIHSMTIEFFSVLA